MNPTERAKMGKLFTCGKCKNTKKTKFIGGWQSLDPKSSQVFPVCKNCLKAPEPVPSADYHR